MAAFAALLLGTALRLVPALAPLLTRADLLKLLPEWRFFAPRPGRGDHHLLYRDSPDGSAWGPWTELRLVPPRRWYHVVWNPERRAKKALLDYVAGLVSIVSSPERDAIRISVPYLALLRYVVVAPPRPAPPQLTQFLILNHDGSAAPDEFVPMFMSEPHGAAFP